MYREAYDTKVDVFALATVIFQLHTDAQPYSSQEMNKFSKSQLKVKEFPWKEVQFKKGAFSEEMERLLRKMLKPNPEERPLVSEIFMDKDFETLCKRAEIESGEFWSSLKDNS